MMQRIVGRDVYRGRAGGGFELVKRDLGNGHVECFIQPLVTWDHECEMSPGAYADYLQAREASKEQRKLENQNRACRRARVRIRQLCKASGVNSLLTLTYRQNVTDLAQAKAHLKAFTRRMKALIPGFFYVAVFERQKRGCWHIHMAIHRLPPTLLREGVKVKSYSVVRAVWRRVVGELGGNIDESRRIRHSRRESWQVASYMSKYMGKAFEELGEGVNRYSASGSITLPRAERIRLAGYSFSDAITLVLDDLYMGRDYLGRQLRWNVLKHRRFDGSLQSLQCCWFSLDTNADDGLERLVNKLERQGGLQ